MLEVPGWIGCITDGDGVVKAGLVAKEVGERDEVRLQAGVTRVVAARIAMVANIRICLTDYFHYSLLNIVTEDC